MDDVSCKNCHCRQDAKVVRGMFQCHLCGTINILPKPTANDRHAVMVHNIWTVVFYAVMLVFILAMTGFLTWAFA